MRVINPFASPDTVIGICGGGQLGRMLCEAASAWNWKIAILERNPDDPASRLAHRYVQGDLTNYDDVLAFGQTVDVVTIEIEKVNLEALLAAAPSTAQRACLGGPCGSAGRGSPRGGTAVYEPGSASGRPCPGWR